MSKRGIDVSKWNGYIQWDKVYASGIDFAIIKAGGSDAGLYTDPRFEQNYKNCKNIGFPVGAYYFVGPKCISAEDGVADAKRFLEMLKNKKFEYPVYLDFEAPSPDTRRGNTEAAAAFCAYMEKFSYYVGIYASDISGLKERLDIKKLDKYDIWVASYGAEPRYIKSFRSSYGMWQYTSSGSVNGITGNVDLDIAYYDFPKIMKTKHLNGF